MDKEKIKRLFIVLLAIFIYIKFNEAQAQSVLDLKEGSLSQRIFNLFFGEASGGSTRDLMVESSIFLNVVFYLNVTVLVVSSVFVAYTILVGILNTAQDGKFLGRKFSSMWIPIRYAIGTAIILPIPKFYGLGIAQLLIIKLAMSGVAIADFISDKAFNNYQFVGQHVLISKIDEQKIDKLTRDLYSSMMCQKVNNAMLNRGLFSSSDPFKNVSSAQIVERGREWSFEVKEQGFFFPKTKNCGVIEFADATGVDLENKKTPDFSANSGYLGAIVNFRDNFSYNQLITLHKDETEKLKENIELLVDRDIEQFEQYDFDNTVLYLNHFRDEYIANYVEQANNILSAHQEENAKNNKVSFWTSGFLFLDSIQRNYKISQSVLASPNSSFLGFGVYEGLTKDLSRFIQMSQSVQQNDKNINATDPVLSESANDEGNGLWDELQAKIVSSFVGFNILKIDEVTDHPLQVVQKLGMNLLTVFKMMLYSTVAFGFIAGGVAMFAGSGVVAGVSSFLSYISIPKAIFIIFAFIAAFVIPLIPSIMWIFGLMLFVLLILEAVVATPLWTMMLLNPNADSFESGIQKGFSLVLSLFLRPVLMVVGLVGAIVVSGFLGEFINKIFLILINIEQFSNTILRLFFVIGSSAIYIILMLMLTYKTFSLIYLLPDQILRWIGGDRENMSAFSDQDAHQIASRTQHVAGAVGAGAASLGSTLATGVKGVAKYARDHWKNKDGLLNKFKENNNAFKSADHNVEEKEMTLDDVKKNDDPKKDNSKKESGLANFMGMSNFNEEMKKREELHKAMKEKHSDKDKKPL